MLVDGFSYTVRSSSDAGSVHPVESFSVSTELLLFVISDTATSLQIHTSRDCTNVLIKLSSIVLLSIDMHKAVDTGLVLL
jgi:hypothetical protein